MRKIWRFVIFAYNIHVFRNIVHILKARRHERTRHIPRDIY
jgi:hypothetical protein